MRRNAHGRQRRRISRARARSPRDFTPIDGNGDTADRRSRNDRESASAPIAPLTAIARDERASVRLAHSLTFPTRKWPNPKQRRRRARARDPRVSRSRPVTANVTRVFLARRLDRAEGTTLLVARRTPRRA